jgi:hypothetical protein
LKRKLLHPFTDLKNKKYCKILTVEKTVFFKADGQGSLTNQNNTEKNFRH